MHTPSPADQQDTAPIEAISREDVIRQVRAWRPGHDGYDHLKKLMNQVGITVDDVLRGF